LPTKHMVMMKLMKKAPLSKKNMHFHRGLVETFCVSKSSLTSLEAAVMLSVG